MTSVAGALLITAAIAGLPPALRGEPLTWLADGTTLVVANVDAASLTVLGTEPTAKLAEIPLEDYPRSVAATRDKDVVIVSLPEVDKIVWVDVRQQRAVKSLSLPGGPFTLVSQPHANRIYVATTYNHLVTEIDARSARITRQLRVPSNPRGLTLSGDGRRLYVVHFLSGQVSLVDTDRWQLITTMATRPDANLARSLALSPDEQRAYAPHLRSNVTNDHLLFDTTVFPVISVFDLATQQEIPQARIALDAIGRPANNPWAAAISADGRRLYVVNAGSDDVQVLDLLTGQALAQIDVGHNPRGIALSPDERRAFVLNVVSRDLSVIDTVSLTETHRISLTSKRLPPAIERGKHLFYSARPRSMSLDSWISCASCHPDGESDGQTWLFAAGPRQTPSLHGAADTLPHNRVPDRDEMQDTEGFIRHIMGGTGLIPGNRAPAKLGTPCAGRSTNADALAAYVASLRPRRSPFAEENTEHMAAVERGRRIFFSKQTGCSNCHPPPYYTDSRLARPWKRHDVGTGEAYDTPSLLGLYAAVSYLHDGRARSLQAVLTTYNREDRHGRTSHLSDQGLEDLVAFLLALPTTDRRIP